MSVPVTRATILLSAVRLEASSSNSVPSSPNQNRPVITNTKPLLSVSKPSWIVRTESNVNKERRKTPDPPCVICRGCGRVECYYCQGKGRTNNVDVEMLPRGEWPKWCRGCGGSGLTDCSRCLGTGEYRYIMGFHFMNRDNTDEIRDIRKHKARDKRGTSSVDDLLQLSNEEADTTDER